MPKNTSGVRAESSKRRDVISDQKSHQELRSRNSLDFNHGNAEGPETPAFVLASSNGALQRLANIAQYFESSFNQDINVVEVAYGTGIDRENEIQRLGQALETLTYVKTEEMENLRHENEELKAGQEACDLERKKCKKMQSELEARYAKIEEDRQEDFERKQREVNTKLQKQMNAKKAEIETRSKEKVRELEGQKEQLSAIIEKLKQGLSAAEEKLETKKIRHARVENSLEEENKKLTVELKEVKSEFPIEGQPVEY